MAILALLLIAPMSAALGDRPVRVATLETPPWVLYNQDGSLGGIFVDLVNEAAQHSNQQVEWHVKGWSWAQHMTRKGKTDAIFPVVRTPERQKWLDYPGQPLTKFHFHIFSHRDSTINFDGNMDVLRGLTIGKIAGAKMHPAFSRMENNGLITVVELSSGETMATHLSKRRIDAYGTPVSIGDWTLGKLGMAEQIKASAIPFGVSDIYFAPSRLRTEPYLFARLYAEVVAAKNSGALERLRQKYSGIARSLHQGVQE